MTDMDDRINKQKVMMARDVGGGRELGCRFAS